MINSKIEYKKMAETEDKLWWYNNLHELVINQIKEIAGSKTNIRILDAGCGTGGLMLKLKRLGYEEVIGFDLSEHAIEYCSKNNLDTEILSLLDISKLSHKGPFDIIVCNDALYFLNQSEKSKFMQDLKNLLKPGGYFISNVPALEAFGGTHDISVGIQKRFNKQMINQMVTGTDFKIVKSTFWPFFVSPLIFLIRLKQKFDLKKNPNLTIESDVSLPNPIVNKTLYFLTKFENKMLKWKPFASSIFWVAKLNK